jgi:hypothetical protein
MAMLFANNASTTLSGNITSSSSSVIVADASHFPAPTGGNYFLATIYDQATKTISEIVKVVGVSGNTLTFQTTPTSGRGQESTTPANWSAGDIIANLVTAGTLNNFVQAGTGPADTSVLYVGTDISGTANLIVATTNPVPPGYADGMTFAILVGNTNTGPTQIELNGLAAQSIYRTDGSPMVGGNLVAGQESLFIWKGSGFSSTVPPIPQAPPQAVFYVDPGGNDNNSGFSPTIGGPNGPFATIQGAINAIKSRYISQTGITLRCANGYYSSGFSDSVNYIASWSVIGNTGNPSLCVINATSSNPNAYVPGSPPGRGVVSGGKASIYASGFTFQTYLENAASTEGGNLTLQNCYFTAPTWGGGGACISAYTGGFTFVEGTCQYTAYGNCFGVFVAAFGGQIRLGYADPFANVPLVFSMAGTPSVPNGVALATGNGTVYVEPSNTAFTGVVPTGPKFQVNTGGGLIQQTFQFPGSQPGIIIPPGWVE